MAKKRSVLTTFVVALLIFIAMLSLTPIHANAATTKTTHTTGIVTTCLLYVRDEPNINSNVIGNVREGNKLTIEEVVETSDKVYTIWLKINFNGKVGYVSKDYVEIQEEELESNVGIVTASLLNVRDKSSINSNVIGNVKKGNTLTIEEVVETSDKTYPTWLKINYNGKVGYVSKNYVDFVDKTEDQPDTTFESYIGIVTASGLNLRSKPTTNSSIITVLKNKSLVIVSEVVHTSDKVNSSWLKVNYNNKVGYVAKQYVDVFEDKTIDTTKEVGIVSTDLNLRTNPTTANSKVKEILSKGTYVEVLNTRTTSDNYKKWYQVRSPSGNVGWVAGQYLEVGKWSFVSTAATHYSTNSNVECNIVSASSLINGEVINPNESFSWSKTVSKYDDVSTVSTTINTAVKRAGIKATENESLKNTLQEPIMLEVISSSRCCMCNVYKLVLN